MSLKPEALDIIRGIQRSLMSHVLPEVTSLYAGAQVQYAVLLLGALASEWDGAAQRLVEDNAALRSLCGQVAGRLPPGEGELPEALRSAAAARDGDLLLSTLSATNDQLRGLVTRIVDAAGAETGESDILEMCARTLRESAARRGHGAL
jgi:hypothetical protein